MDIYGIFDNRCVTTTHNNRYGNASPQAGSGDKAIAFDQPGLADRHTP